MNLPYPPISPAFQDAVEQHRDTINSRVQLLLKRGAKFETADVLDHFRLNVAPIVDAIHAVLPERVRFATRELLEISLELFNTNQLGTGTRSCLMVKLWRDLLPLIPMLVGRDPRRVVGSLCNGLHFLLLQNEAVASEWLNRMQRVGMLADDCDQLLATGKLAAWVSGFAPYRLQALRSAQSLPTAIVAGLMGLATDDKQHVQMVLADAHDNPWAHSHEETTFADDKAIVREVQRCCDFRGFGGMLVSPPQVSFHEGELFVTDAAQTWNLVADRFGWILLRRDTPQIDHHHSSPTSVFIDYEGNIHWGSDLTYATPLVNPTSHAFDGQTLAVTISTSFHVFLFARFGAKQ